MVIVNDSATQSGQIVYFKDQNLFVCLASSVALCAEIGFNTSLSVLSCEGCLQISEPVVSQIYNRVWIGREWADPENLEDPEG